MRISVATLTLYLAVALIDETAAFYERRSPARARWRGVPYGGDASPSSSTPDEDLRGQLNHGATAMASSSQILNSVSAGGGSPADSPPAFIGGRATASATVKKSLSPFGAATEAPTDGSSTSSLSVATNHQQNAEAANAKAGKQTRPEPKRGPLKILFLSSDTGGGHRASAEALANQFQRHFPGTTYDLMDIWTDIDSSWPYRTIKDTYKSFSASPWKWRALYHVSNTALYSKFADAHSYYMNEEMIREKMEEYDPDVVVSVHPTMNYVPLFSIRTISKKAQSEFSISFPVRKLWVGMHSQYLFLSLTGDIPFFTVVTE